MMSHRSQDLLNIARVLFEDALGNLRLRFSRSLLALIGIGVGTAAVIAMLHIGHNARAEAMRQFEEIGADFAMITPPFDGPVAISQTDIATLASAHTGLAQSVPMIVGSGLVVEGRNQLHSTIVGTTEGLAPLLRLQPARGRFVSTLDDRMPFAVIGAELARQIEASRRHALRIGDQIRIDSNVSTVVGILPVQASNPIIGIDLNQGVIIPIQAAVRYVPHPTISNIVARMTPGVTEADMVAATTAFFQPRLRGGRVQIQVASMLLANIDRQMSIYSNLLLAIGIVSLSMGGIGIMNVMLMSVMERREEIGLRAAIGASPQAIMAMFLMESVCLSVAGAAGGTILGVVAGWLFVWRSDWAFEMAPTALPLGAGMALIVGVLFGLYPAWRAACLQPIEALRRN